MKSRRRWQAAAAAANAGANASTTKTMNNSVNMFVSIETCQLTILSLNFNLNYI